MTEVALHDTDTVKYVEFSHPSQPDLRARRKKLFVGLGAALAVVGAGYWVFADTGHVATENAYVNADAAQVTPLVAGSVASVAVVNTQTVRRGDVLLRLDDTDARLALARAEAEYSRVRRQFGQAVATSGALASQVAAGEADIVRARAQVDIASATLDKARIDLARRAEVADSGAVSGEELTVARNGFATAQGNLAQARAGLAQALAARNAAQGSLAALRSGRRTKSRQRYFFARTGRRSKNWRARTSP